ncbi:MAG: exonuclease SbcCD subunit D [Firmicutes bacterium]|nr:exonuclease SbcCD subunit D [Bacillota bacterium]
MKFFHLSDLHIGLKLINHNLREDQEYILDQIIREAARVQPDAVVIAGDLYDRAVPSAEAVELFDHFLSGLAAAVPDAEIMAISGNHDSAQRIDLYRNILGARRIHMIGSPPQREGERIETVTLRDEYGEVRFYLLPFVKPSMVRQLIGREDDVAGLSYDETLRRLIGRETINPEERNVLVSHQFYLPAGKNPEEVERMDSEIRTVGNIDEVRADVLEPFDYAALGHIHKPMKAGRDSWRYSGTPLACSVSEAGQQKGILQVDMKEKGNLEVTEIPLDPLRQVRVVRGSLSEVLAQGCGDYVSVVLTDPVDLDVIDMQDRIRFAFPNLLEIRRENRRRADYQAEYSKEREMDVFELCNSFLKDLDGEEQEILRSVINTVQEVQA